MNALFAFLAKLIYINVIVNVQKNMKPSRNFRDYPVWQDAVVFATEVYKVTNAMPWFEKKGLCDQLQRAVVSIASNIAEEAARPSDIDFAHFLDFALGSVNEVKTQLLISKNIGYLSEDQYEVLNMENISIQKQLTGLLKTIRQR